eukprot:GILJ01004366.1.p1 GENE.GILJ01004366.1~~GILJ01004366.1.p1  ORF type:complete len:327 (-),score=34.26 GILJ01004366.1:212-1126(-)
MESTVAEAQLGDPLTAIELTADYAVVGSMLGRVAIYRLADQKLFELAPFSDEAVRGLSLVDRKLYVAIGDVFARVWLLDDTHNPKVIRYANRPHNYSTCPNAYTMQQGTKVLIFTAGASVAHFADLQTDVQDRFSLTLSKDCVPSDFDDARVLFVAYEDRQRKELRVWSFDSKQITSTIPFRSRSCVISHAKLCGDRVLHVYNSRRVLIWNLPTKTCTHKFRAHKRPIVCLSLMSEDLFVTMAVDRKIKMWQGSTCVRKIRIPSANFTLGFPYFVRIVGSVVFYTCDQGAQLLRLQDQPESQPR